MSGSGRLAEERAYAESLEADAVEFPEERTQCLQEAVAAWRRGGRPERAYELLDRLVSGGGQDGCFARAQRIDYLYADGRNEDAATEAIVLARDPELDDAPCQMMAELFAERDELQEAATWYDRAVARLDAKFIDDLGGPSASFSYAATIVRGRRNVREALGLPPDRTDELVPELPTFHDPGPSTRTEVRQRLEAGESARLQVTVFQRGERAEAQRRWPGEYLGSDEEYFTGTELEWRGLRDAGASGVTVVPLTVDGLVEFADQVKGSPTDSSVKNRYSIRIAPAVGLSWPPSRNEPCWCGSSAKYKKCCGRPGLEVPS